MKSGSIVLVENFEFTDWNLNVDGYKRRCIVLYEEENKVCVCPIISQVSAFNNNPNNYYFLPFTNKKGKSLTFAKLNNIVLVDKERAEETRFFLENIDMIRLINKIKANYMDYIYKENYEEILEKVEQTVCVN